MIINDLDLGPSHPWLKPTQKQVPGSVLVQGSQTLVWPLGAAYITWDVLAYVIGWQALGGFSANTLGSTRYLIRQLEELIFNADQHPVYVQWTNSAAAGAFSRTDEHDGWYLIEQAEPDYIRFLVSGIVECRLTASPVSPATPSSLGQRWTGAALNSTYTGVPVPQLTYPLGSTVQVPTTLSRTGGEGTVPLSILTSASTLNPALFVRSATVANWFAGQCRLFDVGSANLSGNPVPVAGGTFQNANWFQVYGTSHNLAGDSLILTNGLVLLVFQTGAANLCTVYLWNTSLGTPTWQNVGVIHYADNAANADTLREINITRVSLQEVRLRLVMSTTGGNYAQIKVKLRAGDYGFYAELWPLTQAVSQDYAMYWAPAVAQKIVYNEAAIADVISAPVGLATSSILGFGAMFGTQANGPILGTLYQNAPAHFQPFVQNSTQIWLGDGTGPAQNAFRLYGFFAVPFTTAPNLQAEGESGTLGTGWSSVADAAAPAGNTAKVASGTLTGNADLFGTSYIPTAGMYDIWFRIKVTSAANTTAQLQVGLWDATSSAFVAGASTIYAPSQWTTGYTWARANSRFVTDGVTNGTTTVTSATAIFTSADVGKSYADGFGTRTTIASVTNATTIVLNSASLGSGSGVTVIIGTFNSGGAAGGLPITPTAGHNMQFRAVTTATLATDFFVDEAVLAPSQSATLGVGNFPGDLWATMMFERDVRRALG